MTITLAPGCGASDDQFGDPDDTIRFDPVERATQAARQGDAPPTFTCVDSIRDRRWIVEVAAIAAEDLVSSPKPHYAGWRPGRLSDVIYSAREFIAVDAEGGSVTIFSDDFRRRASWGRKGLGPGEFRLPMALTDGGTEDTLWIVDGGTPPQVKAFSRAGELYYAFQIRGAFPVDIARDDAGTTYVAHRVAPRFAVRNPDRFSVIVSTYGPTGAALPPLVQFESTAFIEDRLVLPGLNPVSVVAAGARLVVYYPASGIIDIYENGAIKTSARVCIPAELEGRYREQREQAEQRRRFVQRHFPLITGIRVSSEGRIHAVTSFSDRESEYHVDHFDASGGPIGSTVFSARYLRLPRHVRFLGTAERLFAFDDDGLIATFELRKSRPPGVPGVSR